MAWSCKDIFFRLLNAGLWGTELPDFTLTVEQWEEVHAMANRQAVTGIVYDAVRNLPPYCGLPRTLAALWLVETQKIESGNARISQVIEAQKRAWDKHGIESVVMKGQSLAKMYPVPEHRACGDIDWYFPVPGDWEKANEIAAKNGLKLETDSDGDVHYVLGGIVVEHHKNGSRCETPVEIIVMLVEHVLKHAMVMGVGMKQVCDVAVAYRYYEGQYADAYLESALKAEGLLEWDALLRKVMTDSDDVDVETLRSLILSDGHFGLDKKFRLSGFMKRLRLFKKYAPKQFAGRWLQLVSGRMKRCFTK